MDTYMSNQINKIGIHTSPHTYNKLYKGHYNGLRYILEYNKLYENEYDETDYETVINWIDHLDEDRQVVVNEAIKKLFKSKIEQGLILKD